MYFHQKCCPTVTTQIQMLFEEIFACSQFFPQKCFFIDYQASRSPLTCKQVRGGTSLGGAVKIFSQTMSQLLNYEAVCRTSPATRGLLIGHVHWSHWTWQTKSDILVRISQIPIFFYKHSHPTKELPDIPYVLQRLELTSNGGNGHCVKFHEERERTHVFPSSDSTELDSQQSWVTRGQRQWLVIIELWGFIQDAVRIHEDYKKTRFWRSL